MVGADLLLQDMGLVFFAILVISLGQFWVLVPFLLIRRFWVRFYLLLCRFLKDVIVKVYRLSCDN